MANWKSYPLSDVTLPASELEDTKNKEIISKRIEVLSNAILDAMSAECVRHGSTDVELYISLKYLVFQLQAVLGKERVKALDKSFILVNHNEDHVC